MSEVIEIIDTDSDNGSATPVPRRICTFTVNGRPTPLPRMRYFRNGLWNKVKPQSTAFRTAVKQAVPETNDGVIFDISVPLCVRIWFYLKRPTIDFVGGKRRPANLRKSASDSSILPIGPDVDNLTKFVLDALNDLVYKDDRQVVKLEVTKERDNVQLCNGRTVVVVMPFP